MAELLFDKIRMIANFNRAASTYDEYAGIQKLVLGDLIDQLNYLSLKPKRILDLGSGTGLASKLLHKRFPGAEIVQSDISNQMIKKSIQKQRWKMKKDIYVQSDMHCLPFVANSFDMVFSSLSLQWSESFDKVFEEVQRIIKPNGAFIFSTLGPGSMKEIKEAWKEVKNVQSHIFFDIQTYGNALIQKGFDDPVLSVETMVMEFENIKAVTDSIKKIGASNINKNRDKELTRKKEWASFVKNYELMSTGKNFPLTYEVIYGLAWKHSNKSKSEVSIPVETLMRRL